MQIPDPVAFRQALSRFPTGVTVITSVSAGGDVCGMTANSFTSVSLDPPTILVSLMQGRTLSAITESGCFVVNVLGQDAGNISAHFAGKPMANWKPTYAHDGTFAALKDAIAVFFCRVVQAHPVNDHTLLIARVEVCRACDSNPLVFFASQYRRLSA
jgi:flavin reductase